jgi:uncharacterized membrane protein YqaE (UPF0057 family)
MNETAVLFGLVGYILGLLTALWLLRVPHLPIPPYRTSYILGLLTALWLLAPKKS